MDSRHKRNIYQIIHKFFVNLKKIQMVRMREPHKWWTGGSCTCTRARTDHRDAADAVEGRAHAGDSRACALDSRARA